MKDTKDMKMNIVSGFLVLLSLFAVLLGWLKLIDLAYMSDKTMLVAAIGLIGAIVGGLVSGLLTFLGVKMTLSKQNEKEESERISRAKMLFTQVRFTYDMFSTLPTGNSSVSVNFVIYDPDWNKHLSYVENLDKDEVRSIVNWFHCLHTIEKWSISNGGGIETDSIKRLLNGKTGEIELLLQKYRY